MMNKSNLGIYIHIPFCRSKCPYCDFYSFVGADEEKAEYLAALKSSISYWGKALLGRKADTLYIGGGTPSSLSGEELAEVIHAAKRAFSFTEGEITVECNPRDCSEELFGALYTSGVNRISLGMQSANDIERRALGRTADSEKVISCVKLAKNAGIDNISVDIMLGVPKQTLSTLENTVKFCADMGVSHVSAYMLKLEPGTYYYKNAERLSLPDDDSVAHMYLRCVELLSQYGYKQYEISNFAKPGFESKHNLKYWKLEDYLGIGPSAHSFIDGKRFYYPRDIKSFESALEPVFDCEGGEWQERVMLALRLSEGLDLSDFDKPRSEELLRKIKVYTDNSFAERTANGFRLTPKGFLVSNTIIGDLVDSQ